MFYEKSLFEIDAEEAKLPCQWCEEEVPEDELYHGVCLTCIENYYEPELARQFLENTGLEAIADTPQAPTKPQIVPCDECGLGIPRDKAVSTYKLYGKKLCSACAKISEKKSYCAYRYNAR